MKALEGGSAWALCRHRRCIPLTVGQRLFVITQRIFSLENEAEETLRAASGLLLGRLRIGAIGPAEVTRMVVAFGQRYPGRLGVARNTKVIDDLLAFRADVAIVPRLGDDRRFTRTL